MVRVQLSDWPRHAVRLEIYGRDLLTALLEPVRIRTAPLPVIAAQSLRVYPGEAIEVAGEGFYEQLDAWCQLDGMRAPAVVTSDAVVSCPASLLDERTLSSFPHERVALSVFSESLQLTLTPGVPSRVTVEITEEPAVTRLSEGVLVRAPAESWPRSLVFEMASLVLSREIRVALSPGGEQPCRALSSTSIECPVPWPLPEGMNLALSLQLWPGGPFRPAMPGLQVVSWPHLSRAEPRVLVGGVEGQSLSLLGAHFTSSQALLTSARLEGEAVANIQVLGDSVAKLEGLGPLPALPGALRKAQVSLAYSTGPRVAPVEVLVAD